MKFKLTGQLIFLFAKSEPDPGEVLGWGGKIAVLSTHLHPPSSHSFSPQSYSCLLGVLTAMGLGAEKERQGGPSEMAGVRRCEKIRERDKEIGREKLDQREQDRTFLEATGPCRSGLVGVDMLPQSRAPS